MQARSVAVSDLSRQTPDALRTLAVFGSSIPDYLQRALCLCLELLLSRSATLGRSSPTPKCRCAAVVVNVFPNEASPFELLFRRQNDAT